MNSENKLGKLIKLLRKSMGLTQEQLAEKAEMDYKYLSKIENGKHLPTFKTITRLSAILGSNLYEPFAGDNCARMNPDYIKSVNILESASNPKEQAYYLSVLEVAQKGLNLRSNN